MVNHHLYQILRWLHWSQASDLRGRASHPPQPQGSTTSDQGTWEFAVKMRAAAVQTRHWWDVNGNWPRAPGSVFAKWKRGTRLGDTCVLTCLDQTGGREKEELVQSLYALVKGLPHRLSPEVSWNCSGEFKPKMREKIQNLSSSVMNCSKLASCRSGSGLTSCTLLELHKKRSNWLKVKDSIGKNLGTTMNLSLAIREALLLGWARATSTVQWPNCRGVWRTGDTESIPSVSFTY